MKTSLEYIPEGTCVVTSDPNAELFVTTEVILTRACSACGGTGSVWPGMPCLICGGTG